MDQTPDSAAVDQQATTEAQPTTTNTQPAQEPAQAPQAPAMTPEQEAIFKYVESNGGLEKIKQIVSRRTSEIPQQTQPVEDVQKPVEQPTQPVAQQPKATPPAGYKTQEEFIIEQYYMNLANAPEYAPIADKIRTGEIFKEMSKFNIVPVKDGYINEGQVRQFLDLYSKTVPQVAPATPVSTTPTVDYVDVGKTINSREDAMKVMAQKGHPMHEEAMKFIAAQVNKK